MLTPQSHVIWFTLVIIGIQKTVKFRHLDFKSETRTGELRARLWRNHERGRSQPENEAGAEFAGRADGPPAPSREKITQARTERS